MTNLEKYRAVLGELERRKRMRNDLVAAGMKEAIADYRITVMEAIVADYAKLIDNTEPSGDLAG